MGRQWRCQGSSLPFWRVDYKKMELLRYQHHCKDTLGQLNSRKFYRSYFKLTLKPLLILTLTNSKLDCSFNFGPGQSRPHEHGKGSSGYIKSRESRYKPFISISNDF